MTNLERFRAMSEKEIARFLLRVHDCELNIPFCQNKNECFDELENGTSPVRCVVCMMEWLNKPVEGE